MHPFGGPVRFLPYVAHEVQNSAQANMDLAREALASLKNAEAGILRFYRPQPTAAFAPRDTISEHYAKAAAAMRAHGFEPVERQAGGHLIVYDSNALVIDLVAPHTDPRPQMHERFNLFAGAIVSALANLSIDARIGALPGEYCPGDASVNGGGRVKLAGMAQRIVKHGYHLGAVVSVLPSPRAKIAVAEAYNILGLPFETETFGCITDLAEGLSFDEAHDSVCKEIVNLVRM